jgi:hypothetical protein
MIGIVVVIVVVVARAQQALKGDIIIHK